MKIGYQTRYWDFYLRDFKFRFLLNIFVKSDSGTSYRLTQACNESQDNKKTSLSRCLLNSKIENTVQ